MNPILGHRVSTRHRRLGMLVNRQLDTKYEAARGPVYNKSTGGYCVGTCALQHNAGTMPDNYESAGDSETIGESRSDNVNVM